MVQLKLTVHTGPKGRAPVFKSDNEVWLLASEEMLFMPFSDDAFLLDHEVYIPDGFSTSISTFSRGLYADIKYKENVISSIYCKMYEWGQDAIFIDVGEPVIKLTLTSLSA